MTDQTPPTTTGTNPTGPNRTLTVAAVSAAVALIVGLGVGYAVGSSGNDDIAEAAQSTEVPEPEEETAAPEPEPTIDEPATLKDEVDLGGIKVTVFEYKKDIKDSDGSTVEEGMRWDAALVRACNVSLTAPAERDLIANFGVWSLADEDDGTYGELDLSPSPAPAPEWETFKKINTGKCAKGWLAFDVAKDADPTSIVYSYDDEEEARWSLK